MCWGATVWCGYTWRCSVLASCWGWMKKEGRKNRLSLFPDLRPGRAIFVRSVTVISLTLLRRVVRRCCQTIIHWHFFRHRHLYTSTTNAIMTSTKIVIGWLATPSKRTWRVAHRFLFIRVVHTRASPNSCSRFPTSTNYSSSLYLRHWSRYTRLKVFIFSKYLGNILESLRDKFLSRYAAREYLLLH